MKITKREILAMGPCKEGWDWYLANQEEDLLKLLLKVNSDKTAVDMDGDFCGPEWAWWILKHLNRDKKEFSVRIAIFSSRLVLETYEKYYPGDNRPRRAIEAAEEYINNPGETALPAAWSAAESARIDIQEKILNYAVALLEGEDESL